jgi:peptidoglycan/xylan/chitin deacetylase (PgdA/CDA1 family)
MKLLILNYHRVYPGHHIDPEIFEWQIKYLKDKFLPLTINEVPDFLSGKLKANQDGFIITFDDGWVDNFIYAYPILKKHNLQATIFVSTNFISEINKNKIPFFPKTTTESIESLSKDGYSEQFLTWEEIQSMADVFQIESHGHTHAYHYCSSKIKNLFNGKIGERQSYLLLSNILLKKSDPIYKSGSVLVNPRYYPENNETETPENFQERVKNELNLSIQIISQKTNHHSVYLAWPFGEYSSKSIEITQKMGFRACFAVRQNWTLQRDNPYKLSRFSPPKNRMLFVLATRGKLGMYIYKFAVKLKSLLPN